MHFVTLTTDWEKDDFYTGSIKGRILSNCQDTSIISITNNVKTHNISEAAFIIRNTYKNFPEGSVHIIPVGSLSAPDSNYIIAKIDGHYFLCADNGLIGLLGDLEIELVMSIIINKKPLMSESFPALDILSDAACRILNGENPGDIGENYPDYKKQIPLRATLENDTLTGTVIYIDSYGNAITNITRELFTRFGNERPFDIFVQSKHYKISTLNNKYTETGGGDLLALFNSVHLLEIAICNGSAASLLNLNTDSTIRVVFK